MNQPDARTLTLFDLLARRWRTQAAVVAARFAADGETAAFATADGAVLLAAGPDAEPPEGRIRVTGDLGQITLRPRSADPAPLIHLADLAEEAAPLAAAGDGFLVGAGDGRVLALSRDGGVETRFRLGSAIVALDHAAGLTAAADATAIALSGTEGARSLPIPGVRALSLSRGGRLAIADASRVIADPGAEARAVALAGVARLAWRDDGTWLAAALGVDGVALLDPANAVPVRIPGFPAPVDDLAWSAPGHAFVAAGAFRIAAWDAHALPATALALITGQPGLVEVTAVASHPKKPLIAAGYANGQVTIAQIGSRDELLLRQDGAAVACLTFSADGSRLAIGDTAGAAEIVGFPPQMFK